MDNGTVIAYQRLVPSGISRSSCLRIKNNNKNKMDRHVEKSKGRATLLRRNIICLRWSVFIDRLDRIWNQQEKWAPGHACGG